VISDYKRFEIILTNCITKEDKIIKTFTAFFQVNSLFESELSEDSLQNDLVSETKFFKCKIEM